MVTYTHRVGRFSPEEGRYRWVKEAAGLGPSCSACFLHGEVGWAFQCARLEQFDIRSGAVLLDVECDGTIWGPHIHDRENVVFSTSTGSIYSLSLSNDVVRQLGRNLSNFQSAVLAGHILVAVVAGSERKRYLPFSGKKVARVDAVDLDSNKVWTVRDLAGEAAFVSIGGIDSGLFFAKNNELSRLTLNGDTIWSAAIGGRPRQYVSVSFHGGWGGGLLTSAGGCLALINVETGHPLFEYTLDTVADVIPLRNDAVLFSTCGGGFLSLGDPENYIGLLDPCAGRVIDSVVVHDTIRLNLRQIGERIVSHASKRDARAGAGYVTEFYEIRFGRR